MNPNEFAALRKVSATEGNKNLIVDRMDQYEAFVKVFLQSCSGTTENLIHASLMQFFLYALKDEAIVFHTQLMSGLVPWRCSADHKLLPDDEANAVQKSWSEIKLTFKSTNLSADAVARSVGGIVTMAMTEADSVTSFLNIHRDKFSNFRRQADRTVPEFPSWKL